MSDGDREPIATGEHFSAYETQEENELLLEVHGAGKIRLSEDELLDFIDESKQLKMLTIHEEDGEDYEVHRWNGHCHECGHEGRIIENDIGTVLCPKCRSTNVGWGVGF